MSLIHARSRLLPHVPVYIPYQFTAFPAPILHNEFSHHCVNSLPAAKDRVLIASRRHAARKVAWMFNSPAVQDANSLVWFCLITEIPSRRMQFAREKLRKYEALHVSCDPFGMSTIPYLLKLIVRRQHDLGSSITPGLTAPRPVVITKGKARPGLLERLEEAWAHRKTYCHSPRMECLHWHTHLQTAISAVAATTCLSLIKAKADINLPEDGP